LKSVGIHLGLYTNGGILNNEILEALAGLDFVRVSLDAGSAKTHKLVHGCKNDDDFNKALGFIRKVKSLNGPEIGVSFIVLKENVQEISVAAAAAKSAGAAYLELKPAYLSDYTFNQDVFADVGPILQTEMEKCEALRDNGFRIVSNNQLRSRFAGGDEVSDLTRLISPRPCLTCRLRMVVSPTGCYLCTPHRSKEEYRIGDPMTESLVEIWNGPLRVSMADRLCMYKCAYYEQNELLLKLKEEGRAFNPEPSRSGIPLEQRYFL
ncbi:hypothetical protein HGA64_02695, partial [Candidatus Falkowbacteria bacterium]|nr:hypothetical protein [Candidatus Falkowbacteria bacterium]